MKEFSTSPDIADDKLFRRTKTYTEYDATPTVTEEEVNKE